MYIYHTVRYDTSSALFLPTTTNDDDARRARNLLRFCSNLLVNHSSCLSTKMGFLVPVGRNSARNLSKRMLYDRASGWRRNQSLSALPFSTTNASASATDETDILIVGGGVVGCALVRLLNARMPHLTVGLVEAGTGPRPVEADSLPNPRSYALSPASLELLGLHDNYKDDAVRKRLGFYNSMQVWESHQPASLLFTETDLPESTSHLGAVVEDALLVDCLWTEIAKSECRVWKETTVGNIFPPASALDPWCQVELQSTAVDGSPAVRPKIATKLLVAADGANSHVRRILGLSTAGWDYGQQALTFTVALNAPHAGRAFQRFSENGVMALLPTWSPNHAVVVWSTSPGTVKEWKDNPNLVSHVNSLLQQGPGQLGPLFGEDNGTPSIFNNLKYGAEQLINTVQYSASMMAQQNMGQFVAPPVIAETVSPQFAFPLSCRQVNNYIQPRVALVGDAAHSVHPMAGQGLNLGLQDVANLVDVIEQGVTSGMDPTTFLHEYDRSRKAQVSLTISGIHTLHQVFGVQDTLAKHVKSLGMNMIQNIGPLRRSLVHAACQGVARPE